MICRVATFDKKPDVPEERMNEFRGWMMEQPGIKAHYHLHDPATGKGMSISFWESAEAMAAMKDRVPPGGPLRLKPTTVETYPVVIESLPKTGSR
jgi:hypothetical protein